MDVAHSLLLLPNMIFMRSAPVCGIFTLCTLYLDVDGQIHKQELLICALLYFARVYIAKEVCLISILPACGSEGAFLQLPEESAPVIRGFEGCTKLGNVAHARKL